MSYSDERLQTKMPAKSQATQLNRTISSLNSSLAKSNSLSWRFLLGLVQGVGATLGATIVATIVIASLVRSVRTFKRTPVIGDLLDPVQVEQFIQQ